MKFAQIIAIASLYSLVEARKERPYVPPHYTNDENIIELTPSTFDDYVFGTNYSTIVEFYAPWCGYCQQLAPEFKIAAKKARNFAQFAAVNCEDERNKQFCASQNIKSYPTLLTYRPPKTFREHKPRKSQFVTQQYERQREAPAIVDTMKGTVKSFYKKLTPNKLETFLSDRSGKPKVLVLTKTAPFPVLLKSLAVDFMNQIDFVYLDTKRNDVLEEIQKFAPELKSLDNDTLLLIHPDEGVILHKGKMKKSEITDFLKSVAEPSDGPFSERQKIIKAIKSGKAKTFSHYMKQKAKKAAKEASENNESQTLKRDEL